MTVALIDNGSLEPAAHRNLRAVAAAIEERTGISVAAVSWKHSDRIPAEALGGERAWTLDRWVRDRFATGERRFVFVPFFISPQGAIGSALRTDLESLGSEAFPSALRKPGGFRHVADRASGSPAVDGLAPFEFSFTEGLSSALAELVTDRITDAIAANGLRRPAVVIVDHGGPSPASATVRNAVMSEIRELLRDSIGPIFASSMESPESAAFSFNKPLFSELLLDPRFDGRDTIIAPLFLAPGRHAGPDGDLARIAREAEAQRPGLRCHFAGLVGTHPRVPEILSQSLQATVSAAGLEPAAR